MAKSPSSKRRKQRRAERRIDRNFRKANKTIEQLRSDESQAYEDLMTKQDAVKQALKDRARQ